MQEVKHNRIKIPPHKFRAIQDGLGLDNLEMARLLGLSTTRPKNAVRTVERYRSEIGAVTGPVSNLLWYLKDATQFPPWVPNALAERIIELRNL